MRKLLVFVLAFSSFAFAGPPPQRVMPAHSGRPHHQQIHPVAAPSAVIDNEQSGKAEEEEPLPDFKWWDSKIFNNKQPPFAAVLFNFALLALIFWRFGRKPVGAMLRERKVSIATGIEEAQKILSEAKARAKRYRAKLEVGAEDAEQGKQALVSAGKGEAESILRGADEKAERIKRDTAFLAEQEKKQIDIDLMREMVEKTATQAEALLRKNVTAADQERLAQEFLDKLSHPDFAQRFSRLS